jgi:hypothetical protein
MWKLNFLFFIAVIVTALLMRHEVRRYTGVRLSGQVADFERQRFTRRMICAFFLSIVLAMTYFGYTNKEAFMGRPLFFALYWIACLLLAFSLIVLALLDVRAVLRHTVKGYLDQEGEAERFERFLAKEQKKIERKTS